jgi:hypothetical protein
MKRALSLLMFFGLFGVASHSLATSFSITPAITGSWYDPAQSGQGFSLEVISPSQMAAYFYTFGPYPAGTNVFLTGVGAIEGATATIPLITTSGGFFPPNLDPAKITRTTWGTLVLTFTDCDTGTATWTPVQASFFETGASWSAGSMPISRITTIPTLACQ